MKRTKRTTQIGRTASAAKASSRRTFLKQTVAFAALTSTYSVISLTQLACNSGITSINGGYFNGNYFEGYFENDYFEDEYFDNFFYY